MLQRWTCRKRPSTNKANTLLKHGKRQTAKLKVDSVLTWMPEHHFDMIYEQTVYARWNHMTAIITSSNYSTSCSRQEHSLPCLYRQAKRGAAYDCPMNEMQKLFAAEH